MIRAAIKAFRDKLNAFFAFLARTRDGKQIKLELETLLTHFAATERQLEDWLRFVKDDLQAQVVLDLKESTKDSLEGAQHAAREKLNILQDEEETGSVKSLSSRVSRRSYRSRSSANTIISSKETL